MLPTLHSGCSLDYERALAASTEIIRHPFLFQHSLAQKSVYNRSLAAIQLGRLPSTLNRFRFRKKLLPAKRSLDFPIWTCLLIKIFWWGSSLGNLPGFWNQASEDWEADVPWCGDSQIVGNPTSGPVGLVPPLLSFGPWAHLAFKVDIFFFFSNFY